MSEQLTPVITLKVSDIIKHQATTNIGTAGSVGHGKSTLIYALTGVRTQKFKDEQIRNITKKLGYSGAKIYYNQTTAQVDIRPANADISAYDDDMVLVRHVSFIDCPGHHEYMSTMVAGASIMDHVFFVVAANESIPQPQTYEHLLALMQSNLSSYLILHNKLDLLKKSEAVSNKIELDEFIEGSPADGADVIPISAERGENIDKVCNFIQSLPPCRDIETSCCRMTIVRSFNHNRPNTKIDKLIGAVVGGTITSGVLTLGDIVEIRPGIMLGGKVRPLYSRVTTLECEGHKLQYAVPGGLVSVGLELDAGLSAGDRLVGSQLGHIGSLSDIANLISGRNHKIKKPGDKATNPFKGERVKVISNGAMTVLATVTSFRKKTLELKLDSPIPVDISDRVAILRGKGTSWKLYSALDVQSISLDKLSLDKSKEPDQPLYNSYQIVNDVPELKTVEIPSYNDLLDSVTLRSDDYHTGGIVLKAPVLSRHTRYTHFENAVVGENNYLKSIDLSQNSSIDLKQLITEFFRAELSSDITYNESGHMIITGIHKPAKIKSIMQKLADKFFRCSSCDSVSCYIEKVSRAGAGAGEGAGAGAGSGSSIAKVTGYRKVCTNCPTRIMMKTISGK